MTEVIFLGVGEAFDEELPNTSILIRYGKGTSPVTLLLDCGFTAPPRLWKEEPEVDILDGTPLLDVKPYVSHFDSRDNVKNGWLDKHFKNGTIPKRTRLE